MAFFAAAGEDDPGAAPVVVPAVPAGRYFHHANAQPAAAQ
jgi:hypothetical protein